ncbi:hypothetical protein AC1031_001391 [Aphanomyces cochlioides]|nr:hypothetical protein AC1031_001391 [Aphanomyces cochlioides]
MTSVERLNHYNMLEEENPIPKDELVNWPSQGYSMRYREHLDLVLSDIEFAFEPGHQVGICGRTGSGKSSLMAALFRMVPSSSGHITIDGVRHLAIQWRLMDVAQESSVWPDDTILDSDRILVLDAGTVNEYGTPSHLLAPKEGAFA